MVETTLRARHDEHAPRAERHGLVERELEVGRVLRLRVTHDPRAALPRPARGRPAETESRSPTTTSTSRPSGERAVEPAVGRDRRSARGHGDGRAWPRGDDHDVRLVHARSSAGITQVRFCGSAAPQPPSQPGCPSSPVRSPYRSRAGWVSRRPRTRARPRRALLDLDRSTRARDGPRPNHATSTATFSASPSSSASTAPSGGFRTQPAMPSSSRAGARSRGTTRPARGRGRRLACAPLPWRQYRFTLPSHDAATRKGNVHSRVITRSTVAAWSPSQRSPPASWSRTRRSRRHGARTA